MYDIFLCTGQLITFFSEVRYLEADVWHSVDALENPVITEPGIVALPGTSATPPPQPRPTLATAPLHTGVHTGVCTS
jgi:hypothetical protein